jgi:Amt family ammonium transporter
MEKLQTSGDVLFILIGAILILAMHAGFAFLELGTVRKKNQVNALVKILTDFAVSAVAYFFIGYSIAYGVNFFAGAEQLAQKSGYEMVKFFFLLTFAAAIPAIISGGIAERAKFHPPIDCHLCTGWIRLPLLRRHDLEPQPGFARLAENHIWR